MAELIDLTNKRFGMLVVIRKGNGRKTSGGQYIATWICKCDCGNEIEVDGQKLRKGHTRSCGCLKKENKGSNFEDLTGKKFNRLTVVRFIPKEERTARQYDWLCQCECGNFIKANAYKLKQGLQQSCGCLKEEMKPRLGELTRKYKHSNKRLYSVYKAMIDRCYNENCKRYKNYGGRGIKVCDEWLGENGYDTFAEWSLKTGYDINAEQGKYTIDRINVNGNYEPDNCRWITNSQQQNNKTVCRYITYKNETHSIAEWSRILKVPYTTLYNGLTKYGKSLKDYMK